MKFVLSHPLNEEGMQLLKKNDVELYIANSADSYSYLDELKTADAFIIRVAKCVSKSQGNRPYRCWLR